MSELKKSKQLGDREYKVHLDGYNQTKMFTGEGPSKREEVWYFGESTLGAVDEAGRLVSGLIRGRR